MATLDSIFKKKSGKGKKPATLNVQSVAAALEPKQQNGTGNNSKNSTKDADDDDEWISVKDKKKVIANTTGRAMETFVQEMVEEEIDLVSKIQIEETRNLLQSVRERNIQNMKEIATTISPDPAPPVPTSQSTIWKSSRLATKKLPEKEDFPTLGSTFKTDVANKTKGLGEKSKESPTSIWEIPSLEQTRKNDSSSSPSNEQATSSDITSSSLVSDVNSSPSVSLSDKAEVTTEEVKKVTQVEVNNDTTRTTDSTTASVSDQTIPVIEEKLTMAEANTSKIDEVAVDSASSTTSTAAATTTTSTDKPEVTDGSESKTEASSSEDIPAATRKPKKKKGVFMEV